MFWRGNERALVLVLVLVLALFERKSEKNQEVFKRFKRFQNMIHNRDLEIVPLSNPIRRVYPS